MTNDKKIVGKKLQARVRIMILSREWAYWGKRRSSRPETYNDGKGEDISRLANWSSDMRFGTPPIPIPGLFADQVLSGRNVNGILKIPKLNLLNCYLIG